MYCLYLIVVLVLISNVDSALCCYIFVCCQLRNQETSFNRMLNGHIRAFFVADLVLRQGVKQYIIIIFDRHLSEVKNPESRINQENDYKT